MVVAWVCDSLQVRDKCGTACMGHRLFSLFGRLRLILSGDPLFGILPLLLPFSDEYEREADQIAQTVKEISGA